MFYGVDRSVGVKKLGGKKLGGAKIAKAPATTDWDNTDAALPASEPEAAPVEEFTSDADGFDKLTCKLRAQYSFRKLANTASDALTSNMYWSPCSCSLDSKAGGREERWAAWLWPDSRIRLHRWWWWFRLHRPASIKTVRVQSTVEQQVRPPHRVRMHSRRHVVVSRRALLFVVARGAIHRACFLCCLRLATETDTRARSTYLPMTSTMMGKPQVGSQPHECIGHSNCSVCAVV